MFLYLLLKVHQRFRIIIRPFIFWVIRTRNILNVCLQTYRNNGICLKVAYFLRKIQTLRVNNSTILRIKNAKFSGYCFHMNPNIQWNFQICVSVSLIRKIPVYAYLLLVLCLLLMPSSLVLFSSSETKKSYSLDEKEKRIRDLVLTLRTWI